MHQSNEGSASQNQPKQLARTGTSEMQQPAIMFVRYEQFESTNFRIIKSKPSRNHQDEFFDKIF